MAPCLAAVGPTLPAVGSTPPSVGPDYLAATVSLTPTFGISLPSGFDFTVTMSTPGGGAGFSCKLPFFIFLDFSYRLSPLTPYVIFLI